ncbi:hypothetical protein BLA60_20585 [Actinophytocola xinjiangensis]|uniref:Pyridoxamine 5'-phosphate oxidase N-terminal domain-containing protein n=1 Tax=Actinophytocola xinjiangensis TaxID=485602 RepID=A0A7Z0WJS7_9PSEU|nr:pyridoxamine 5'-phosphate oxidase family protein [Actinophytocola xinjiangensis]OLF08995.1 hypothetical protein BLA60_20585 [Actinophytocola xinjiangensis]
MPLLTEKETAYLLAHRVGRLATTNADGVPHVIPTNYHLDPDTGTIGIGHVVLEGRGQERLYLRNLTANPHAAFVVDDWVTVPHWTPTGITLKGTTVLHPEGGSTLSPNYGPRWLEITPTWVSSWGIDTSSYTPATPRKLPPQPLNPPRPRQ